MKVAVFLGAGFSSLGSVPLASQLFDDEPAVDRVSRERLVSRVIHGWQRWHDRNGGYPEQYMQSLASKGTQEWFDAVKFVGLVIALHMGRVERVGMHLTITRHNVNRTTNIPVHERFWDMLCGSNEIELTAVVTTNYDILAERGLRHKPRPRVPRPGFNYGVQGKRLAGGGYPSYSHIVPISAAGTVPVLKLHGSVSWCLKRGEIVRYLDCRPAIRGDALIVPPTTEKHIPDYMRPIWHDAEAHLLAADVWVVVGYSFPAYDIAVNTVFQSAAKNSPAVHVFDKNPDVAVRVKHLLPGTTVYPHAGLPEGLESLQNLFCGQEKRIPDRSDRNS